MNKISVTRVFSLEHSRLKINGTESKMSDKKILSPEKQEQLAEVVRIKNARRNIKMMCGGKCTGKSYREIGIDKCFQIFLSLFSSEIEHNFFRIS